MSYRGSREELMNCFFFAMMEIINSKLMRRSTRAGAILILTDIFAAVHKELLDEAKSSSKDMVYQVDCNHAVYEDIFQ